MRLLISLNTNTISALTPFSHFAPPPLPCPTFSVPSTLELVFSQCCCIKNVEGDAAALAEFGLRVPLSQKTTVKCPQMAHFKPFFGQCLLLLSTLNSNNIAAKGGDTLSTTAAPPSLGEGRDSSPMVTAAAPASLDKGQGGVVGCQDIVPCIRTFVQYDGTFGAPD